MNDYFQFTALDGSTHIIMGDPDKVRAFFQAERDETLGRWRDPENPNIVVYPHDDVNTTVHDETTGAYLNWSREQAEDDEYSHGFGFATARAYFAAHPEPKPWEEAKAGEVWILTRYGAEEPFFVTDGEFTSTDLAVATDLDDPRITDGRRIWPEGENK